MRQLTALIVLAAKLVPAAVLFIECGSAFAQGSVNVPRRIAAGSGHTLAISASGTMYAWGDNSLGQLGVGLSPSSSSLPTAVSGHTDWRSVSSGVDHALALRAGGSLYAWGSNAASQLGPNTSGASSASPVLVSTLAYAAIAAGGGNGSAQPHHVMGVGRDAGQLVLLRAQPG